MNNSSIVLITQPVKTGDPTQYTSKWAEAAAQLAYSLGYTVVQIKGEEVNYNTLNEYLYKYKPRLYLHVGHGCISSLMGQRECILTNGSTDTTSNGSCKPSCDKGSNLYLLDGTIVVSVACYSGSQLGVNATRYADSYFGYNELLLFPVDNMNSQDMFKDVHLVMVESLLSGDSISVANQRMKEYEDYLISTYKGTKYIALPLLWNQKHRIIHGDRRATIW